MGQIISKQQIQKLKSDNVNLHEQQYYLSHVKTGEDIEQAIKKLLSIMTVKEKLGQLQQISYGDENLSQDIIRRIASGGIGSFLNTWKVQTVNKMQEIAMQQSRLKIPILIGKDVIHGFRTVFPIPLAQAASFNPSLVQKGSRIAAIECSSTGVKWTFAPMVDIARDPRWGRIAEGYGEDTHLASVMGAASVKGFQYNLKDITAVAACGKHFVGYGAAQGGRDYNTTIIPQPVLRDVYLPPFKACLDSGCLTYMSAFNDLNGTPASANAFTLKTILRNQWKFNGFVVSDWDSVGQLIKHGYAEDWQDAARKAFNNGVDMQMDTTCFFDHMEDLFNKKASSPADLDTKVANVLRVKFKMNLFQNYYTDPARQSILLDPKHKAASKAQALECPVLLQNNNKTLPISLNIKKLAVIGPLADDGQNQLGCWAPDGRGVDVVTPLKGLRDALPNTQIIYSKGCKDTRSMDTSFFNQAINAAGQADQVVLFVGQDNGYSGESHSRAYINLPGVQEELIKQVAKIGKPVAVVINAGRSLLVEKILGMVDSVLFSWQLGTMAGQALADLLTGKVSPSGKLPVTFLRAQGQIPTYYNKKNTGRPNNSHEYRQFTSSYLDIDTTPLFPFGYGLSYTTFSYSDLKLSKTAINFGESLLASATIKNEGSAKADQVVFLFVRDLVGSHTRPVKELKDFEKITLAPGESRSVTFSINSSKLAFWTEEKVWKAEAGKFNVWIGKNSQQGPMGSFQLLAQKNQEFQLLD